MSISYSQKQTVEVDPNKWTKGAMLLHHPSGNTAVPNDTQPSYNFYSAIDGFETYFQTLTQDLADANQLRISLRRQIVKIFRNPQNYISISDLLDVVPEKIEGTRPSQNDVADEFQFEEYLISVEYLSRDKFQISLKEFTSEPTESCVLHFSDKDINIPRDCRLLKEAFLLYHKIPHQQLDYCISDLYFAMNSEIIGSGYVIDSCHKNLSKALLMAKQRKRQLDRWKENSGFNCNDDKAKKVIGRKQMRYSSKQSTFEKSL